MPLSKHIYSSMFIGREELSLCHYLNLQLGGSLNVGEEASLPPSRLNPAITSRLVLLNFRSHTYIHSTCPCTHIYISSLAIQYIFTSSHSALQQWSLSSSCWFQLHSEVETHELINGLASIKVLAHVTLVMSMSIALKRA